MDTETGVLEDIILMAVSPMHDTMSGILNRSISYIFDEWMHDSVTTLTKFVLATNAAKQRGNPMQ